MAAPGDPIDGLLSTLGRADALDPAIDGSGATRRGPAGASGEAGADEAGERPERLDRYVLLRELGRGGMGVVYAAYDNRLDRKVAIKLVRDAVGGPEAHARMLREARALARLAHPHVVGVYEVGEVGQRVFLVMELVEGVNLRAWLAEGPRSEAEILAVFLQAADGLAAAHAAGLVHRDIKPDNLVIGEDGRVRVMDFGLARRSLEAPGPRDDEPPRQHDPQLTAVGALLGTPAYMAPEQHLGLAVGPAADIYSFAVALYEALHGQRPFGAASTRELSERVLRGRRSHTITGGRAAPWLQAVIDRGMALEPGDRWPSMAAFSAALRRDPRVRRRRLLAVSAAIAGALLLALTLPPAWHGLQLRRARERAEAQAEARLQALQDPRRDREQAEAAFAAFAAAEEHRGTRALTRAWLRRGQTAWSNGQVDAGLDAMARAYIEAREPADIVAVMRAIAGVHHARWQLAGLAAALDVLAEHGADDDPEVRRMRLDVALDRNDLATAAALAAPADAPLLATLARGRRLGLAAERMQPVDPAGRSGFLVLSERGRRVTRTDAALRPLASHAVPEGVHELVAGAPAYFAGGPATTLYEWSGEAPVAVWRCPAGGDMQPRVAARLDVGAGPAYYFGAQWTWRGFYTLRPAASGEPALAPAHADTHAGFSDIGALLAADLDDDGRRELVVGTSVWHELDLRVLRAHGNGLELVDMVAPGRISGLAVVGGADTRLAALKDDRYAPFTRPPHTGAPAGVHLYRWRDDRLVEAGYLPVPHRDERAVMPIAEELLACDLDGDARTDLVVGLDGGAGGERERRPHAAVFHQREDGGFDRFVLGVRPLACAQLDDDAADELVVRGASADEHAVWGLGVGDEPVPPLAAHAPAGAPPFADPLLAERWSRAERLVASGLTGAAVRTLRDSAELTADAAVAQALLVRAAALLQDDERTRAAAALYERAAGRLPLPPEVALRAAEARLGLGEPAAAAASLRALADDPAVAAETREAARRRLDVLAPLAERTLELRLDEPLDPAWRLDPLVLRREAGADLRVETANRIRESASFPLVWDGGPVAMTVELTVDHLEAMDEFDIAVVDADGHRLVSVGVFGPVDSPRQIRLSCHDPSQPSTAKFLSAPTATRARRRVRARTWWEPRGGAGCDAELDDQVARFTGSPAPAVARPGPMRLVLTGSPNPDVSSYFAADLHAITLHGLERGAAAPAGPVERAARLLVEDQPAAAEALLASVGDASLLRFLALDRMRRQAEATAALRAHVAADASPERDAGLLQLLRSQPDRVGPPLRDILGVDVYPRVSDVVRPALYYEPDDPWLHELHRRDLPWMDGVDAADPATRVRLWLLHALTTASEGRTAEARAATWRAVAAADEPFTARAQLGTRGFVHLATLLADEAPAEAIAAARVAIETSQAPASTRLRLRALPEFDVLALEPGWQALVGPP
ncbi:MAG: serine/threonine protein kinase [Myxococcales bacterium]|nr:serine/threonine protein kinase [Myxococcales bacterium]